MLEKPFDEIYGTIYQEQIMINRLFRYLASARYPKALQLARTLSEQNYSPRELSFILLSASMADLFQGSTLEGEDPTWRAEVLQRFQEQHQEPNEFLTLLMGMEGSKLFQAAPEDGLHMLGQAASLCRSQAEKGGVLFFQAVYTLNKDQEYQKALEWMMQARKLLEGNQEYSLYSLIRFWNETMMAHCSNQLGNFKDSDTLSRQVLLQCRNLGLDALLENCFFNLAFAAQGMGEQEKAEEYLKQNLDFWRTKKNTHKEGLALTMASVVMGQMGDSKKSGVYKNDWEALNYPHPGQKAMMQASVEE